LPLFEVAPGVRIAVLNILGDVELTEAAAQALSERLQAVDYDVLVTAEAKSIPLAYALAVRTRKPYVVLRKAYKPYMGDTIQAETLSITTGKPQTLYLDEKDRGLLKQAGGVGGRRHQHRLHLAGNAFGHGESRRNRGWRSRYFHRGRPSQMARHYRVGAPACLY